MVAANLTAHTLKSRLTAHGRSTLKHHHANLKLRREKWPKARGSEGFLGSGAKLLDWDVTQRQACTCFGMAATESQRL